MREMHADLVRAAGQQLRLEQRQRRIVVVPHAEAAEDRLRVLRAVVLDAHAPLAFARRELREREPDAALLVAPASAHQHDVPLVERRLAQLFVQRDERRALLREQHRARRVAVEPVDELEEARVRPRGAHLLDEPGRDPAAAVDRQSGRLVDDNERVVLVQDRHLDGLPGTGRDRTNCRGRRGPHRRHAHDVPEREPRIGADASLVHAHLTAAHDPVDVALRNALEDAGQEVVDALPRGVVADGEPIHGFLA